MKVAVFTICSDNLVEPALNMLYSFIVNNTWFKEGKHDFNIMCDKDGVCPLSEENRNRFKEIYDGVIFREIDYSKYEDLVTHQQDVLGGAKNFKCVSYKYEIFKDYGYQTHVFFDVDVIIKENISEMFFSEFDFAACLDVSCQGPGQHICFTIHGSKSTTYFNSGMMIVGRKMMGDDVYNDIIKFNMSLKSGDDFKNPLSWKGNLPEQDCLNEYFDDYALIPIETYNNPHMLVNWLNYHKTKVIHYCGDCKPWKETCFGLEMPHMIYWKYDYMRRHPEVKDNKYD